MFSAWISTLLFVFLARFHVWKHPEAHHPARDPAGPSGGSAQGVLGRVCQAQGICPQV